MVAKKKPTQRHNKRKGAPSAGSTGRQKPKYTRADSDPGQGPSKEKAKRQLLPSSSDDDSSNSNKSEKGILAEHEVICHKEGRLQNEAKDMDDDPSNHSKSDARDAGALFSDENAVWLKPKKNQKQKQLLHDNASSKCDNDDSDEDVSADDASSDDDDDMLFVERQARELDEQAALDQVEADEDMQQVVKHHTGIYRLPSTTDQDQNRVIMPPSELRQHIASILEVVADFKTRREAGKSRKEYLSLLGALIAELYGYIPELVEYFLTVFGPAETAEFVRASDETRPLVIRTNTLRCRRKDLAAALMKRGVALDPLAPWSKVGLKIISSTVPMGATPEYLAGHYMLQSAASMCPVLALNPQPNETILDAAAAPGGKTSYIAQLMRNTGAILANDVKAERQKATVANLHRLGVKNVMTCHHDARKLGTLFKNRFDRVLLDAPCSGLGVISRDPSCKVQRTMADILKTVHLQKELLLSVVDSLKAKGSHPGVLVYSTCSVSVAENEEVVNYALTKRDVRLVETGLEFGQPGFTRFQHQRFHPSLALTRRFYPHVHNMDGFFVAKFEKLSNKRLGEGQNQIDATKEREEELSAVKEGSSGGKPDEVDAEGKLEAKKRRRISVPPLKKITHQRKKAQSGKRKRVM